MHGAVAFEPCPNSAEYEVECGIALVHRVTGTVKEARPAAVAWLDHGNRVLERRRSGDVGSTGSRTTVPLQAILGSVLISRTENIKNRVGFRQSAPPAQPGCCLNVNPVNVEKVTLHVCRYD
jgi:hypothetical protein